MCNSQGPPCGTPSTAHYIPYFQGHKRIERGLVACLDPGKRVSLSTISEPTRHSPCTYNIPFLLYNRWAL